MKRILFCSLFLMSLSSAHAVKRHPTGVNVNTNGGTIVYITFGELNRQTPAEGLWCGEIIPATPDIGMKCDPSTILGALPARFDQSKLSQNGSVFTDIMTIPASVSRKAYQEAVRGKNSAFFYVRRFTQPGGPDEYVPITCRLTGGGARVPFALLDVSLSFKSDTQASVLFLKPQSEASPIQATLQYTGTGRLKGRWEVVRPGQEKPTEEDLKTEASLTPDRRGLQRRFLEIGRFNEFLPPTGRYTLQGPDPSRIPTDTTGEYWILLRVEASDDREGDSDLSLAGAGEGILHSGAVASGPLPVLRYVVGSTTTETEKPRQFESISPTDGASMPQGASLEFRWTALDGASQYRLELTDLAGNAFFDAVLDAGSTSYNAPPFLRSKAKQFRWRVVALAATGSELAKTEWKTLHTP